MKKINLSSTANDLDKIIKEISIIKIQLVKYANDPDLVRSLAKRLEKLL